MVWHVDTYAQVGTCSLRGQDCVVIFSMILRNLVHSMSVSLFDLWHNSDVSSRLEGVIPNALCDCCAAELRERMLCELLASRLVGGL